MASNNTLLETNVLIVGTGPAGASAAALLSTYGISNMVINKYGWTCRTPRAHITNQRTMEALRDLGLEAEVISLASPQDLMGENTFCTSLAGEEIGRVRAWGTPPDRRSDYDRASPTNICDCPQNLMEPILIRAAAHRGSKVRFDTEYMGLEQDDNGVTATLRDRLSGKEFRVRAQYLIGADGANSKVVDDIKLPLEGRMGLSGSINMVFHADLSKYVAHRPSILYWVIQPGSETGGLGMAVVRMVRPWYRWLAIWGYEIEDGPPEMTEEVATHIVHNLIGDHDVPVKIEATSTWTVNDMYATSISQGRVFCMGDAIHRHSPMNGLGSNSSIQDAFNLCWKLAMVIKGQAAPTLLDTYNDERAPVARQIVKRATKSIDDLTPILTALGLLEARDTKEMKRNMARRNEPGADGDKQREAIRNAIYNTQYIYNCHGVEMNMRYESSAVVPDGTTDPGFERDRELYHQASSRPGAHIPHAWISKDGHRLSTLDLCGKGKFTLITGISGGGWEEAARSAGEKYGIEIYVHRIGPGLVYEDPFGEFAGSCEVSDTGALLVRPDMIVGWRANELNENSLNELPEALGRILGKG